jgi:hypothetical protein
MLPEMGAQSMRIAITAQNAWNVSKPTLHQIGLARIDSKWWTLGCQQPCCSADHSQLSISRQI